MGQSPAHRFGQWIGELLEAAVLPHLRRFARKHQLFLDEKGPRASRPGKKCTWVDLNGNAHDLDFVLERGGSAEKTGEPVAFIETAWRRYTKHSRNKVQEIQGALEPLAQTYRHLGPFKGAILAGVFTDGALAQLRSLGFVILYFPYESVVEVLRRNGIDAAFDETTSDATFRQKVKACENLLAQQKAKLASALVTRHRQEARAFFTSLEMTILRHIERIVVLALFGHSQEVRTVEQAIALLQRDSTTADQGSISRYEIEVRYSNGDIIQGAFHDKLKAIEFLRSYQFPRRPTGN